MWSINNLFKFQASHTKFFINSLHYRFSYEDAVEKDDISRTVKEVVEEVNIFKYIDFSQNNAVVRQL